MSLGACAMVSPRAAQSAWVASTVAGVSTAMTTSAPPPAACAGGSTVWRDHRPSLKPLSKTNSTKVGEVSTGWRPSSAA